jgi:hypothetical protein
MRAYTLAVAVVAAAGFASPIAGSAAVSMNEMSSQVRVETGPGAWEFASGLVVAIVSAAR